MTTTPTSSVMPDWVTFIANDSPTTSMYGQYCKDIGQKNRATHFGVFINARIGKKEAYPTDAASPLIASLVEYYANQ